MWAAKGRRLGLLDRIIGRLGGQELVQRLAREEVNVGDSQSPDVATLARVRGRGAAPGEGLCT